MKPNKEQQALLDLFSPLPEGNLILNASAGSGKTTVGGMVFRQIEIPLYMELGREPIAVAVTFARRNAIDFASKLPDFVTGVTMNGWCYRMLRATSSQWELKPNKWIDIAKKLRIFTQKDFPDFSRVLGLAKSAGLPFSVTTVGLEGAIRDLIETHALDYGGDMSRACDLIKRALEINDQMAVESHLIDFDDQMRLVAYSAMLDFEPQIPPLDILFIDEVQDLDYTQHQVVREVLACNPDCKVLAVGDPNQACYGFRGAMNNSFHQFAETFSCTEMPLSVSFRSAKAIIEVAQGDVPKIQAWSESPQGEVIEWRTWDASMVEPDTAILCRNMIPLVTTFYQLLKDGLKPTILGREMGKNLGNLLGRIGGKGRIDSDKLLERVSIWEHDNRAKALRENAEERAAIISEQATVLSMFINGAAPDVKNLVQDTKDRLAEAFSEDKSEITLSTIHRSKGFEWKNVIILDPWRIPSRYATQPWQLQQEYNLRYIATTRAERKLIYAEQNQLEALVPYEDDDMGGGE